MKERVRKIILENIEGLNETELTDDMQLITSGYIDSFEIIQMIDYFEQEFNIILPLDEIELSDFESVNDIVQMLQKRGENKI